MISPRRPGPTGLREGALGVAVTVGPLQIPPTYFAVQHLLLMPDVRGRVFAITARISDPAVAPMVTGVLRAQGPYRPGELSAAALRLRLAVRRFRPQLVQQHFATWCLGGAGAARDLRIPLVTTLHGMDVFAWSQPGTGLNGRITARNLHTAADQSAQLLAVSRWLADEAIRRGWPSAKIDVQYQGVDTEYFTPASRKMLAENNVLFVGNLLAQKGIRDAIRASIAIAADTEHTLRIIGAGALEAEVRAAAADHPHIRFDGSGDREQVRAAMREAAVLVLPTQRAGERREAAGLVLLEAQACGTPVVAYASGGTPEMLLADETGVLVPEGDEGGLADALRAVLNLDAGQRRALGRAAREFVVTQRSAAGTARQLRERYQALTGR